MKSYLIGLFTLITISASAQTYKPFKVNVSLGYAKPLNSGVSGGFLFGVEPKYGLSDNFDLGLRVEMASVARGIQTNGNTVTGDVGAFTSFMLTGNYLFGSGTARPFLGAGVGVYSIGAGGTVVIANNGQPNQNIEIVSATKIGGMVRGGVKIGHFVAAVEYNAAPTTKNNAVGYEVSSENAYLGIKVGVDIGGGRR